MWGRSRISKKEQDKQDQLRWQDKQDVKFYPAYPAAILAILLILSQKMKRKLYLLSSAERREEASITAWKCLSISVFVIISNPA